MANKTTTPTKRVTTKQGPPSKKAQKPSLSLVKGEPSRWDGWMNVLSGLGVEGKDKRRSNAFSTDILDQRTAQELWRGNDMAAKIIEKVPREMLRRGYDVRIQDDNAEASKAQEEAIETVLKNLQASSRFYDALCYERAYGGGAILVGANDGAKDLREPLNEQRLQSVDYLTAFTRDELYASAYYSNPLAPRYGEPARYRLQPKGVTTAGSYSMEIHESRLLVFPGIVVDREQRQHNQGWGDSVLTRVNEVLSDFNVTWGGVAALLQDFAIALYKIKGLAAMAATNQDDKIKTRIQLIDLMKSILRGVMLDADEDFERKTTSLAGIPEVLEKFMLRLSAAADLPVSLLMGQAPAGLNATGASDIRFFYDDVSSKQTEKLVPHAERLVRLLTLCRRGPTRGQEPKRWHIAFRPLWQMTEMETAELRHKTAQTDQIYITANVLSPEEVAVSRFGGDAWSPETTIDLDARKRMSMEPEPEEEEIEEKKPDPKKVEDARQDAGSRGVMVALYPPRETALGLVVPGGEPATDLHLTLCYLGKAERFTEGQLIYLRAVLVTVSRAFSPLVGQVAGVGRFPASPQSDGLDVLWAAVGVQGLPELRQALCEGLRKEGLPYQDIFGFTPHITLAYLAPEQKSPIERLAPRSVSFGSLSLVVAGERTDYPLGGAP